MKIKRSYKGQKVMGKQFDGIGVIEDFHVSKSNIFYVDVRTKEDRICHTPLALVIPYLNEKNDTMLRE